MAAISEEKMQIVINNYFKIECDVDTSIRQAFEKGFRIGVKKGQSVPECIQNNTVHLCDSCQYTYPTCPSLDNDVIFGDGKGNDNICTCNKYRPKFVQQLKVKPKWVAEDRYTKDRFAVFPYCPKCNYELETGDCYCRICGQYINWSEDDE